MTQIVEKVADTTIKFSAPVNPTRQNCKNFSILSLWEQVSAIAIASYPMMSST
ncbi:MAG: hypothetical protein V7K18_04345 [Nostoc sp.]|uniref:hypothetical protein n=1 Tax=Nostoc sp. TaxID=1180 RepID=UPI002FFC76B8